MPRQTDAAVIVDDPRRAASIDGAQDELMQQCPEPLARAAFLHLVYRRLDLSAIGCLLALNGHQPPLVGLPASSDGPEAMAC